MTLFLSVNAELLVSLWDSPAERARGAEGEKFVDLELTIGQIEQLFEK